MELFRLTRQKYADTLSGKGAAIKGARWNSVGVEIIYTASSRALAMAEVSVHFSFDTIPSDYMMMTIFVPDAVAIQHLDPKTLPLDWNAFPHPPTTQVVGDAFVFDGDYCLLKIPSVVVKGDFNYLINPKHSEFDQIQIVNTVPFPFDSRLFQ